MKGFWFGNPLGTFITLSLVALMVISSPIVMLVNPALAAATSSPSSDDGNTLAPSTIGQDGGGDFTKQAALPAVFATQSNNIVNTKAIYEILIRTATAGTIKTVEISFPAGTNINSPLQIETEGIGPGSYTRTGQTLIFNVQNPVNVPADTRIRFEIAVITNPSIASNTFTVTVTTKDTGGAIIDGPTASSAYNIKQIGSAAIANNAVTTPKIADGAIQPQVIDRAGTEVSVLPNTFGFGTAACLTGETAVSGGLFVATGGQDFLTLTSSRNTGSGWQTEMWNSDPTNAHDFTPRVTCMPAMP